MRATATAPSRSSATITVAWGLINIPVSLFAATEETRVARKEFSPAGNPCGRQVYDKVTGEVVEHADIVKRVEVADGVVVDLTDEEIATVTGSADGIAHIEALIPMATIGREYFPSGLYQARPKADKKSGAAAAKAFALLTAALRKRDQAALVKVTIRGSAAKYAALTPDGYLVVLHYTDAVREPVEMPLVDLTDQELAMADVLLDAMETTVGDMVDSSSAAINDYLAAKMAGIVSEPVAAGAIVPPVDIMASLAASVEAAKAAAR